MIPRGATVLIDANLLVLLVVGTVNRATISRFKRTSAYSIDDFTMLVELIDACGPLVTLPHILAEVSNLTDLPGPERAVARNVLKERILALDEHLLRSAEAAADSLFTSLGLTDAAISALAKLKDLWVLTDDLNLYNRLGRQHQQVVNFNHLRDANWGPS